MLMRISKCSAKNITFYKPCKSIILIEKSQLGLNYCHIRLNKPKNGSAPFNLKKKGVISKNSCSNTGIFVNRSFTRID